MVSEEIIAVKQEIIKLDMLSKSVYITLVPPSLLYAYDNYTHIFIPPPPKVLSGNDVIPIHFHNGVRRRFPR